jgi:predicted transposase YbfD/YdcC
VREVSLAEADPMATGFPYSRTIVTICSHRTQTKGNRNSVEDRHYLSSQQAHERTPEQWINLTRSHWSVENRNHWRRDATLGEDRTRLNNANALANLALLRSVNLRLLSDYSPGEWMPAKIESLAAHPQLALHCVLSK